VRRFVAIADDPRIAEGPLTTAIPVASQLGTWLDAVGLGELVAAFQAHNVDGGTVRGHPS